MRLALTAALAAAAASALQSTFVSPNRDLAFALSVPDTDNTDIFFSIRAPISYAWAAVGLGSDDMKGALFLIIYRNKHRDNVTLSPRLAYGNYEPQHYPDMQYDVLPGSGIDGDHMVLNARCTQHCRSWPAADSNSGYMDVSSASGKAIFAMGPRAGFGSDSPAADLQFHREFGVFSIDIKRTLGAPDPPKLEDDSESVGTSLDYRRTGRREPRSSLHGSFMVFSVVFLLPVGAALRSSERWARFHSLCQSMAVLIMLAGVVTGVLASFRYQRSRNFRAHHQIIGFIVVGFVLAQLVLGFLHQRKMRKTNMPTNQGRYHRYLGGAIIIFGVLNAFFGFDLALDYKLGYTLCGFVLISVFVVLFLYLSRRGVRGRRQRQTATTADGPSTGYQPQPWREEPNPPDAPPSYDAASSQYISLQPVPSRASPWRGSDVKDGGDDQPALGGLQRPREFT
ncbi:iron reductase domain protein [Ophiocordyceps camponoti-floridani]|uniref:Iron reductase domain protein n=1 Tax=Ophiocordyceps camponoti-floridani TaxID=2030778 RepID=A0A8H4VBV7_9HYPO|nr:iron reductase domain protein [Ophiocordyceps camponoti-floridani]